jgi:hypothetical protein
MESLSRPNVMPTNVDKLAVAGDQDGLAATSAQAAPARDLTKTSLTPSQSASCTRRERGNSLDHLSSANLAINAATVGDGQFDIVHYVQCPAMSAGKITAMSGCGSRHRCTMRLGAEGRHPAAS